MSNVYGPFNVSEWETLLSLKKSIDYEKKHSITECLEKDQENYISLINKAA